MSRSMGFIEAALVPGGATYEAGTPADMGRGREEGPGGGGLPVRTEAPGRPGGSIGAPCKDITYNQSVN